MILSPDYNVISVAMLQDGAYKRCERGTRKVKKNHDLSDYLCNEQEFTYHKLVAAAEDACEKLKDESRNNFPAKYEGPGFKRDPPYFTYPVFFDNRRFSYRKLLS